MPVHITRSEAETAALAAQIAAAAIPGRTYLLNGPLGAGKSVFARAFVKKLCGENTEVPSPTFTLVQTYEAGDVALWHFDLYRLQDPEEIFEIGWEDSAQAIRLVEWPERLGPYTPQSAIRIDIHTDGENTRKISIDGV